MLNCSTVAPLQKGAKAIDFDLSADEPTNLAPKISSDSGIVTTKQRREPREENPSAAEEPRRAATKLRAPQSSISDDGYEQ